MYIYNYKLLKTMKRYFKTAFFLTGSLLIIMLINGCEKKQTSPAASPKQSVAVPYMSAMVNGVTLSGTPVCSGTVISLMIPGSPTQEIDLVLEGCNGGVGTWTLGWNGISSSGPTYPFPIYANYVVNAYKSNEEQYQTTATVGGTLVITQNVGDSLISGTFSFDALWDGGTISVSNGVLNSVRFVAP